MPAATKTGIRREQSDYADLSPKDERVIERHGVLGKPLPAVRCRSREQRLPRYVVPEWGTNDQTLSHRRLYQFAYSPPDVGEAGLEPANNGSLSEVRLIYATTKLPTTGTGRPRNLALYQLSYGASTGRTRTCDLSITSRSN